MKRIAVAVAIVLGGCHSVGPRTIEVDRTDYSTAIAESWKEQTLLNVVKLRYADLPIFVDIGQIVAGYSLETAVSLGLEDVDELPAGSNTFSLGGSSRFTDRPTITYTPLTGGAFVDNLITPIAPASLFSAIEAGWPADLIVRLGVSSINGIGNEQFSGSGYFPAAREFERAVELMRELQLSGDLTIRVERAREGGAATLMVLRSEDEAPSTAALSRELRGLLRLDGVRSDFSLVYGRASSGPHEVAVQSRSILNILQLMSSRATLPEEHVREGRALPTPQNAQGASLPGFKILSSEERPEAAFVARRYRNTWFYIEDTDFQSKRVFSLMLLLFTLADSSVERAAPLITIPAQ